MPHWMAVPRAQPAGWSRRPEAAVRSAADRVPAAASATLALLADLIVRSRSDG